MTQEALREVSYSEAVSEAIREELRRDERVFIMGEDIRSGLYGDYGADEFGPTRVRDTPISELGFVGAAVGAALTGMRPIVHLSSSVFLYNAMDQVINQMAKSHYMFGGQRTLPVVIRTGLNYGSSNAAHHSDRPYSMFMNVPGLKIVVPTTPHDAKGFLKQAVREDDPVIIFEDVTLSGSKAEIVADLGPIPFGEAAIRRHGNQVTIVGIAGSQRAALSAATELDQSFGVSTEVLDPRCLVPLDKGSIIASVEKTGRLVVVEPGPRTCGAAAEISAIVAEEAFLALKSPIVRLTAPDVPVPFSPVLERTLYPNKATIVAAVRELMEIDSTHDASV